MKNFISYYDTDEYQALYIVGTINSGIELEIASKFRF